VFLLEPAQTQFDLRFRLFGIPVRVHPMFWVLSAVLGWGGGPDEGGSTFLAGLLVWVAVCFVSILIHEMGHVFMGRAFGGDGHIVLYSFGGLAIGITVPRWWQRVLVSFAGPLAQFVLLGVTLAVAWQFIIPEVFRPLLTLDWHLPGKFIASIVNSDHHELVQDFFIDMIEINLFWPVLNLLPIWPLDGGQISREVFTRFMGERGVRVALGLSMVVAGLLAINALCAMPRVLGKPLIPYVGVLFAGGLFMVLFFGLFALQSFQALQALETQRRWREDHWDD
jgi:Zn-dependent protease